MYSRSRSNLGIVIALGILAIVVCVAIGTVILQWAWAWVIPDVFSGAVKHGILPSTLTFWQAFKLSFLMTLLVGASRSSAGSSK